MKTDLLGGEEKTIAGSLGRPRQQESKKISRKYKVMDHVEIFGKISY